MAKNQTLTNAIVIFIGVCLVVTLGAYFRRVFKSHGDVETGSKKKDTGTCELHTCGALDPVSDPKYNIQQVIEQMILLEDHLVDKRKRCRDCIVKHFCSIMGLLHECVQLAGSAIGKYTLVNETCEVVSGLYKEWLAGQEGVKRGEKEEDAVYLAAADRVRVLRKQLVAVYVLGDDVAK